MEIIQILLIISTLLVSLVAGFLFAFSLIVMPGIKKLADRSFLKAFREMDLIIQNGNPLFMLVWVGSILSVMGLLITGIISSEGLEFWAVILIATTYLAGVQLPTVSINIPLNNRIQKIELNSVSEESAQKERENFESRWNRSNRIRTLFAVLTSLSLIILLCCS